MIITFKILGIKVFQEFDKLFKRLSLLYIFYMPLFSAELKNQTLNIIVTMDAFGNPMGLASDLKESFEGLFFEGDFGGFVSGLGYGVTNSISKVRRIAPEVLCECIKRMG